MQPTHLCVGLMTIALVTRAPADAGRTAPEHVAVLNTRSCWRGLFVHAATAVRQGKGLEPIEPNIRRRPVQLPANWTASNVDDSGWAIRTGPFFGIPSGTSPRSGTSERGLICLRNDSLVQDPAKATGLTVSVGYRGGAVVYVNGREIARSHLPAGDLKRNTKDCWTIGQSGSSASTPSAPPSCSADRRGTPWRRGCSTQQGR